MGHSRSPYARNGEWVGKMHNFPCSDSCNQAYAYTQGKWKKFFDNICVLSM